MESTQKPSAANIVQNEANATPQAVVNVREPGANKQSTPELESPTSKNSLNADDLLSPVESATSPFTVPVQFIPFSDAQNVRPAQYEVIERRFREGEIMGIGRLSTKNPTAEPTFINIKSKVVSRCHGQVFCKDGQIYIKDVGSSSGTFVNKTRLSATLVESVATPLNDGDIIYFGAEFKDKNDVNTRRVSFKLSYYDQSWIAIQRKEVDPTKFRSALTYFLMAANPSSKGDVNNSPEEENATTECCICLSETGPLQALFFAPCSHTFHYKCVHRLLFQSPMFQCPLCRQVSNLTASLSAENLNELAEGGEEVPFKKITDEEFIECMTPPVDPNTPSSPVVASNGQSTPRRRERNRANSRESSMRRADSAGSEQVSPKNKRKAFTSIKTFFQKVGGGPSSSGSHRELHNSSRENIMDGMIPVLSSENTPASTPAATNPPITREWSMPTTPIKRTLGKSKSDILGNGAEIIQGNNNQQQKDSENKINNNSSGSGNSNAAAEEPDKESKSELVNPI